MYEFALDLSIFCWVAVGIFYVSRPSFSLFHPFTYYYLFHGIIFVARPILADSFKYDGMYKVYDFMPSASDKLTVIFASNLGFLVFAFACLWAGNVPMSFKHDKFVEDEKRRLSRLFVWVCFICLPFALYSLRDSASSFANGEYITGISLDRTTGTYVNTVSNGYLTDAQMMLVPITAIFAWLFRFRIMSLVPFGIYVLLRSGTGSRGPFIVAIFVLSLFFLYERRIRVPRLSIILVAVLTAVLFRTVGDDRGASIRQSVGYEAKETVFTGKRGKQDRFLEAMDFANMEFFEYLVYVIPQRSGTYDYFLDNLQVFTEPVPRVLWSGKPVGEPLRRVFLFKYGFPIGMTRSLPGEGWYAAGWTGVVLWCGFWGWALGIIYRKFADGPQTTFQTISFLIFTPMLILFYRDGQLLSLVKQLGIYMMPVLVWLILARMTGVVTADRMRHFAQKAWEQAIAAKSAVSGVPERDGSRGDGAADQPAPIAGLAHDQELPTDADYLRRRAAIASRAELLPPAVRRRREALGRMPGTVAGPATGG